MRLRLAALLLLVAAPAAAHSWYDATCCSEKDCHPYEGKVVEGPDGYRLEDGTVILHSDPRVKQGLDEDFHICIAATTILCFYRPLRGT